MAIAEQRGPGLRAGLRLKLFLAASILLLIPLLGFLYVRELEHLLLKVQEQGVVATARAVGTALNDRPSLFLSGEVYPFALAQGNDLRIDNLPAPIVVDGLTEDWARQSVTPHSVGAGAGNPESRAFAARYRIGRHGNAIYALFEVSDARVVLRDPEKDPLQAADHLEVAVVTPDDEFLRFAIDARGTGKASVYLLTADGEQIPDTRIQAMFRLVPGGYLMELRLPRSLVGPRLGFTVANVDDPGSPASSIGTSDTSSKQGLGAVIVPSPEVSELVRRLGRARSRIWVLDVNHRVIAQAGSLRAPPAQVDPDQEPFTRFWEAAADVLVRPILRLAMSEPNEDFQDIAPGTYRLEGREIDEALAGQTGTRRRLTPDSRAVVLSAAQPVWLEDKVVGAVLIEETTNDVLALRNRAFEKLFAALLVVYVGGTAALLIFATRLSLRIRRLRDETENSIDPHGRVLGTVGGSDAGDELGDLSRSFADILRRLQQYTGYLETLAGRLSHELRTPVAVVRSSLDNLKQVELPDEARVYLHRAEEGLGRLTTIFTRMSEATRLEQSLASVEREHFDLAEVVRGCVEGYRLAHRDRNIVFDAGPGPFTVYGAPDLVAQMLDKLAANAVEFSAPDSTIRFELQREYPTGETRRSTPLAWSTLLASGARLSVFNAGPPLPADMQDRLFESMISVRNEHTQAEPHLGLGLYIVRLIAEFHGARASALNREDGSGVVIRLEFPLAEHAMT
ncbi:MAG: proteobacterial dedicated sortase system histidine kinase [Betaproteobacteria bacterium]|nr:proteobacterial dedicated sortase system histidine kinase [Betaproteobacteria bacterium]